MNNFGISYGPIQTIHFLSVFSYMNTLSDIFYSLDMIEAKERSQHLPTVNALFEHLSESNDELETKRRLIRKMLGNSDLYGWKDNETLDVGYINATFDHIISNVVFSRYGNIYGYLAKILDPSQTLTFSSLRETIFEGLKDLEYMNEDGSFSYLSFAAIEGIMETLIMPLFPELEEEMRLIDVDYIYAQAGSMLARSTLMNTTDFTLEEYLSMSQAIELAASHQESYQSALPIFTLPALLFYAHQENESFSKGLVTHSMRKQDFWIEAFQNLFSYLREIFETISRKELEKSPTYQFALAIKNFKNRTSIAREMLKEHCPGIPEDEYESEIGTYKFLASSYSCSADNLWGVPVGSVALFSEKLLPNIDELYAAQFDEIERKYHSYAKMLIREAIQKANLTYIINSTNITIFDVRILPETSPYGYGSLLREPVLKPNEHLFTVDNRGTRSILFMINKQNNITMLTYGSWKNFTKEFGLLVRRENIQESSSKSPEESLDDFENKIAERLAKDFIKALYDLGYDKTTGEQVLDFVLMFVPFYDCITNVRRGNSAEATTACMGDIAMLIPFGAQLVSVGSKLSTLAARSLVAATGVSVRTLTLRHAIRLAMQVGPTKVLAGSIALVQKEILTKQMFKSLSLGLVRSVDPGLELIGRLSWKGATHLVNLFEKIWQSAEKFPSMSLKSSSLKKVWISLKNRMRMMRDVEFVSSSTHIRCKRMPPPSGSNPLPSSCTSREVVRHIYPGGENPQGPQFLVVSEGLAELRQTIDHGPKKLVIPFKVTPSSGLYYKEIDPVTRRSSGPAMRLNKDGLLKPISPYPRSTVKSVIVLNSREKMRVETENNIERAAKFISEANLGIPVEIARELMNPYILAIEPVLASDSSSKLSTSRKIGESSEQNVEAVVPTHLDFAHDFVKNGGLIRTDIYNEWFVKNPQQLHDLFFLHDLGSIEWNDSERNTKRIVDLYGPHFEEELGVDLRKIIAEYIWEAAHRSVSFEDFFAIKNFILNGFVLMENNANANRLLQIALLRLAIRQGSFEESNRFPTTLHFLATRSLWSHSYIRSFETDKKFITLDAFQVASSVQPQSALAARNIAKGRPNQKLISFKLYLNSGHTIANLNNVLKSVHKHVIVPNAKFRLKHIRDTNIGSSHVYYLGMEDVPIKKEIWLRDMVQQLEALQEPQS